MPDRCVGFVINFRDRDAKRRHCRLDATNRVAPAIHAWLTAIGAAFGSPLCFSATPMPKRLECHAAPVSLYVAHYNWVRVYETLDAVRGAAATD
jgi:hypothetical protein